jgi:hypothetical protein
VEKVHFAQKQSTFSYAEVTKSSEYDAVKRAWARQFVWKAGKYVASFEMSSPYRMRLTQVKSEFELTDTDIEILNKNLTTLDDYHKALLKQAEDGTAPPLFNWNWRYPKTTKLRA